MATEIARDSSAAAALHDLLSRRRSVRAFAPRAVTEPEIHGLVWAAQGVTDAAGRRTTPSAGGTYPLEVYAVTEDGVLRYEPETDEVIPFAEGDRRPALQAAVGGQISIAAASVTIVLTGDPVRLEARFGSDVERYLVLEVGHAAQNVLLEAVALGLCAVPVGRFDAGGVRGCLALPVSETPIELVVAGHPCDD